LTSILEALSDQIGFPEEVRAGGRFTAFEIWLQLQADVFELPNTLTSPKQSTAAGASIVGWSTLSNTLPETWTEHITIDKTVQPNPENNTHYRVLYSQFCSIRERLKL
jgi:sugar (pentulose or hexulose) kinase